MGEISKEAVAGVWPLQLGEAHITMTFPSISATAIGRLLGSIYGLPYPIGFLIHLLTLPLPVLVAVGMYVATGFRRYQLTSQRVRIRRGIGAREVQQVPLAELDSVRLQQRPGQNYYRAADLELVAGDKVLVTLPGVPNHEAFQHNILEARAALLQVRECVNAQETAAAASP